MLWFAVHNLLPSSRTETFILPAALSIGVQYLSTMFFSKTYPSLKRASMRMIIPLSRGQPTSNGWLMKGIKVWFPYSQFRIILKGHTYSKVPHGICWDFYYKCFSVLLSLPSTASFTLWHVLFQGVYWNKLCIQSSISEFASQVTLPVTSLQVS